jgi:hypothetical protein
MRSIQAISVVVSLVFGMLVLTEVGSLQNDVTTLSSGLLSFFEALPTVYLLIFGFFSVLSVAGAVWSLRN